MKRYGLLVLAATVVVTSVYAGGDKQPAALDSGSGVTLKFWDMQNGNDRYPAIEQELIKEYEKQTGNKIEYQCLPWDNWYQQFTTAIASKTNPDVSGGGGYMPYQFYVAGNAEPMDDIYDQLIASGEIKDFLDIYTWLKYDSHYVAVLWNMSLRVIMYNKDILAKYNINPPKTWAEFREAVRQTTRDGIYGFSIPRDSYGSQNVIFWMLSNDGGLFTEDKKPDALNPRNVEAVTFLTDMAKAGYLNPAAAGMVAQDVYKLFESGRQAFIYTAPTYGVTLNAQAGRDWVGILSPPESPNGTKAAYAGLNALMVYKSSVHTKEAKEFALWWCRNNLRIFTEGGVNDVPAFRPALNDKYFDNEIFRVSINEWVPIAKHAVSKIPYRIPEMNEFEGDLAYRDLAQGVTLKVDPVELLTGVNNVLERIMNKN
jgi:multiple sugar transport system substrate-binding protein